MANALTAFNAIVNDRNVAFVKLSALEAPALETFNALIGKKHSLGSLSPAEDEQLATAEVTLNNVHHGMWIVGQVSLEAMNDSALLRDIRNALNGISNDLTEAKARLERIGRIASTAADVATALATLAEKLKSDAGPAALLT